MRGRKAPPDLVASDAFRGTRTKQRDALVHSSRRARRDSPKSSGRQAATTQPYYADEPSVSGRTWYGDDSPHLPWTAALRMIEGQTRTGTGKMGENGQRSTTAAIGVGQDRRFGCQSGPCQLAS